MKANKQRRPYPTHKGTNIPKCHDVISPSTTIVAQNHAKKSLPIPNHTYMYVCMYVCNACSRNWIWCIICSPFVLFSLTQYVVLFKSITRPSWIILLIRTQYLLYMVSYKLGDTACETSHNNTRKTHVIFTTSLFIFYVPQPNCNYSIFCIFVAHANL
jgi:hypothetical protein